MPIAVLDRLDGQAVSSQAALEVQFQRVRVEEPDRSLEAQRRFGTAGLNPVGGVPV